MAAGRVVWYLARNPAVAMELMRCNLVPVLYHGLAKQDVADQLPLIGALRFKTKTLNSHIDYQS